MLPGELFDGLVHLADPFDFGPSGPLPLTIGEDGLMGGGQDHRGHGPDGRLF